MAKTKVFICDDHFSVRLGLKDYLGEFGVEVVGEAATSDECLLNCLKKSPEVIIVDLKLDKPNGLQLIEEILKKDSDAKVLVYSMENNIHTIKKAYNAGAMGYVTKSMDSEHLLDAVHKIVSGEVYFMEGMAQKLALMHRQKDNNPSELLNETELEIFKMVASGISIEETARRLDYNARSVTNKLVDIRKKLSCTNTEFPHIAIRYGLYQPEI